MVCAKPLHPQCFLDSCLYLVGFEFGEGSVAQTIEGVHQPLMFLTEASLGGLFHRHVLSCRGSTVSCEACFGRRDPGRGARLHALLTGAEVIGARVFPARAKTDSRPRRK